MLENLKKKYKINISEKQKKIIMLGLKAVAVCIFFVIYLQMFIQGLYKENDGTHWKRIVVSTALFIIPSVLLFIKIKIPKIPNMVVSVLFSAFVIKENFIMLQMSQGYKYNNFGEHIEELNMLIVVTIFLVFYAIFNSFKGAVIGLNIVTVVFGLANYFLVSFRGTGFLAVDVLSLETAANVAEGYTYTLNFYTYLLLISSITICFLAVKLGKNTLTPKWWRILPVILAIGMVARCNSTFLVSDEFDKILKIKYFKPQETFNTNGMYATFIKSIKDLEVEEPEGYSVEAVKEIAKENQGTKATVSGDKVPNIIMVMDEAFTDFASFTDLKTNKDCMPFFHSMKENTVKGQMFVSVFGGGTASTEFEALTSNTMAFVPNGITAYTTYINSPMPSLTTILKSQNYGGLLAMHPYKGNGYKRNKVYPLLGFNKFITLDDFTQTKYLRNLVSDEGDVDRVIEEYEKYREDNSQPFYMFNVTMQNHSPFDADFDGLTKEIKLQYDIEAPQAERYLNLMKHTDDALKKLVEYFKSVNEPTIIVFYGDHQPKVEDEFYKQVKKGYKLDDVYKNFMKYNTQFVIWANYDIEEKDDVYISSNYMSSLVLDTAGLAKSGYEVLVSKIREQVPIITKRGYVGKDGNYYENGDKNSPYYSLLQKYNLAEYNNIFDAKKRVDKFFETE